MGLVEARTVTLRGIRFGKYEQEKWQGKKVIETGYAWRIEELVLSGIRKYDRAKDGGLKRDEFRNNESKESAALAKKHESQLIVIEHAVGRNVGYDGAGNQSAKISPREPFSLKMQAKGMRLSHRTWALATTRSPLNRVDENRFSDKTFMEADMDLSIERLSAADGSDVFRGSFLVNAKDGSSAKFAFSGRVPSKIYLQPAAVFDAKVNRTMGGRVRQTIWADHYTPKTSYFFEYLTMDINGKGAITALLPRRFKKEKNQAYLFGDLLNLFLPAKVFLSRGSDFSEAVDANLRKLITNGGKVTVYIKPETPVAMKARTFIVDDAPKEFGVSTSYSPK